MSIVAGLQVPLTPFVDAVGSEGTDAPAQIFNTVPKVNVGVRIGFTVTVNVVLVAHKPAFGVNVYVAEDVLLTTAGLQVPAMPLVELFGSAGMVPPEQIVNEVPKLKAGTMFGATVTVKVTGLAHPPAGVNVYVAEAWLLTVVGLHVPVTPLLDVVGKEGTAPPAQMLSEVPKLNTGVTMGFTATVNVVVTAHCPASGVKV